MSIYYFSKMKVVGSLLLQVLAASAMRLDVGKLSRVGMVVDGMSNDESVQSPRDAQCTWPSALSDRYSGQWIVGRGANACVYLARDHHGTTVAIKSAKAVGRLGMWRGECAEMQRLRFTACRAGRDMLSLAQMYLPTCLEVGGTDEEPYYVMHAAGPTAMQDVATLNLSTDDQKSVFAQMVAGIYALHAIGITHNDLHGGNIVLDGTTLSIIDFGSMRTLEDAWLRDYKRDGNAIWRWAAVIAGCPEDAGWRVWADEAQLRQDSARFFQCIQEKWEIDDAFLDVMTKVIEADIAESPQQHVQELYNTAFVQQHLPALQSHYTWEGAEGCLAWSQDVFAAAEEQVANLQSDLSGLELYKCGTVPTVENAGIEQPCSGHAVCFSLRSGVDWSCASVSGERSLREQCLSRSAGYDGACLTWEHEQHSVAREFDARSFVPATTTTTTTVVPDVPIGGHTPYRCESLPTWDPAGGITCSVNPYKVACFSLVEGVIWSCGGRRGVARCTMTPDNTLQQNYHGACMMAGHSNYGQGVDYNADTFVPDPPSTRRRRRSSDRRRSRGD